MPTLSDAQVEALELKAYEIRKLCLEVIASAGWGHLGGSLSQVELLAAMFGGALHLRPDAPDDPFRDLFVLSKAHASPSLYAALAVHGFLSRDRLFQYCRLGGLDGHTQRAQCPGIEFSGGSLGTGLSFAAGLALSLHLQERYAPLVCCLVGDGECNEGQVWEAAMFAAHHRLDNLVAVIDYNKVMAKGRVCDLLGVEPLRGKFAEFGWTPVEIDGHDVRQIAAAFHRARHLERKGRPVVIVAHTVKGRGIPECEFSYHWHTHAPAAGQARSFLDKMNRTFGRTGDFERPLATPGDGGLAAAIKEDLA